MKNKDTPRRDPDLVEPSNLRRIWVNNAGEPVELVIATDRLNTYSMVFGENNGAARHEPIAEENAARLPPALGEALLLLFCSKNRARHVMGDLEEIFHEDIKTKGKRRAKLLYWAAVLRSIGPLLWVKLRRAGLIALLLEIGLWCGLS
jgi:hypothetical protein